jgi:glutamate dehydrogenase
VVWRHRHLYQGRRNENDFDVGDRANDAIRIHARQVRRQGDRRGRQSRRHPKGPHRLCACNGGSCNSDAIDNSAGVNSSDVEVNIKIALANAMRENRLTRPKRNTLLAAMTDEVAELVLRNNYLQTLAISVAEAEGVSGVGELNRVMGNLEARGLLNRKVEDLPDDVAVAERVAAGRALTRPEIGVLLSYAKLVLFDEIVASGLPDDPLFRLGTALLLPQEDAEATFGRYRQPPAQARDHLDPSGQ